MPKVMQVDLDGDQFHTYSRISPNHTHSFLFESLVGPEDLAEVSVMGFDPRIIIKGYCNRVEVTCKDQGMQTVETDDPLSELKRMLGKNTNTDYRYLGGAAGFVNYNYIRLVEGMQGIDDSEPLMEFGIYDDGLLYDHMSKNTFYFHYGDDRFEQLSACSRDAVALEPFETSDISALDEETFAGMVNRAKEYIHAGDIFQVVLSRKFGFRASGDPLLLYGTLRSTNPSPYMYHMMHGTKSIIGTSPEMLVRVTGGLVETFPIAGTAPVTGDPGRDAEAAKMLLQDPKELAEHTMLVDLGRNDIGRVCRYGSVRPVELMKVKQFSHVQHMVTHLEGVLDDGRDMFDAFRAIFPAGTVSGAPKIRAVEIIDELEPEPRGTYAGAVGYFSFNGCCDFAIAIRSIFVDKDRGYVQSGAGIVADSIPQKEFEETQHKAGAMLDAMGGAQ